MKALKASHERDSIAESLCRLGPEQGYLVDAGHATTRHVDPHPRQGQFQYGLVGIGALPIALPPRPDEFLGLAGMTVQAEQSGSESNGSGLTVVVAEFGEEALGLGSGGVGGLGLTRITCIDVGTGDPAQQVGPQRRCRTGQVSSPSEVARGVAERRELVSPVTGCGQGSQRPILQGHSLVGVGHGLGRGKQVVGHDRERGGWRRVAQCRDSGQVGLAPVPAGEHPVGHLTHDVLGEGVPPELSRERAGVDREQLTAHQRCEDHVELLTVAVPEAVPDDAEQVGGERASQDARHIDDPPLLRRQGIEPGGDEGLERRGRC